MPKSKSESKPKPAPTPDAGAPAAARSDARDNKRTDPRLDPRIDPRIDARLRELADWRGDTLAQARSIILDADPLIVEEWKWRGVPVWSRAGIVCTGESYRAAIKLTFAHGAALPDPAHLFNASLDGNTRRAIDLHAGDLVDAPALRALVQAAVAFNLQKTSKRRSKP